MIEVDVALVWMAPEPADAEQSRALSNWARAHGVRLTPPSQQRAVVREHALPDEREHAPPDEAPIANGLENLLEQARDAIAAHDGVGADGALSSAESMLRAHPELPQGAWLMAEVERARAARWRRVPPADTEAAEDAWLRAEALDGGRVPGLGEDGWTKHPPAATVVLDVTPEDAEAWLDGHPVRAGAIATWAGPHSVILTWQGAPVWAAWIEASPGRSTVHASATTGSPCSTADMSRAHLTPDGIDARHVRCRAWVIATAGPQPGNIRVANCEGDRCGPLIDWRAPPPWTWSPAIEPSRDQRWPAWAIWGLVGAGAAIAAGAAVFAVDALQPAPTETRFVNGGIKTH